MDLNQVAYESGRPGTAVSPTRRSLILHDSLTFLLLTLIAVALFGVTFFLFRSFATRRDELAREWTERGRAQLQAHQPTQAVTSLRAALSYGPDNYQTELMLAQALADSGEIDQATNYFLSLWATRPGDGLLNLQLARLARRKDSSNDAIKYYRASIFGDWRGDGAIKRRDARLELVDYLETLHQDAAARAELLIAAGNAPDNLQLNLLLAGKLQAAADASDALIYYNRALVDDPHNQQALQGAGELEYARNDYLRARDLLLRVESEDARAMAHNAARLIELSLSRELPAEERSRHILLAARIAEARLAGCPQQDPDLENRWHAAGQGAKRSSLAATAAGQDLLTQLIFDTERETERQTEGQTATCAAPTGDDALLLKLAATQSRSEQP